jgi:hypothetical protein
MITATVSPGPPELVMFGGAYSFFVVLLLMIAAVDYDEDMVAATTRRARLMRSADATVSWRHGASILYWKRCGARDPSKDERSASRYVVEGFLHCLGWIPTSEMYRGLVRYSNVATETSRAQWRLGLHRVRALNNDEL